MSNPPTVGSEGPQSAPSPALPAPVKRSFWHPGSFVALLRGSEILVAIALLTAIFIFLAFVVIRADLQPTNFDIGLTHEIQELPQALGPLLVGISYPGFAPYNWMIAAAIVLFMFALRWRTEMVFTIIAGAGGLTAEIIKGFVDRPRPTPNFANIYVPLTSPSFPSGHVTGYVTLYGFIFYLAYTLLSRRGVIRWVILVVTALLILLVGPSRVYMGQHWASDALAGYALGFAYLLVVVELYRLWLRRHPKAPQPKESPT